MSQRPDQPNPLDPFGAWRTLRDANMEAWARLMVETVNSPAYAQAMGALLDAYLTSSAPFQQSLQTTMTRALAQLNMSSRADVTSLAERLTNIELRLDDLDARLETIERAVDRLAAPGRRALAKEQS